MNAQRNFTVEIVILATFLLSVGCGGKGSVAAKTGRLIRRQPKQRACALNKRPHALNRLVWKPAPSKKLRKQVGATRLPRSQFSRSKAPRSNASNRS
ncbi:hypothetical protein PYK22_01402 [Pyrinomonas methylaliphatogenes]|uniref:Lipoprotein n=1 Tax=Pyrinomonas methylaliphatogenes TaxID=454194 RepID=A0A0B6WVV1_9BACT|nr:hypothetical protein PYK22_01402 [Pyrinomonas methylaliphatogenes]